MIQNPSGCWSDPEEEVRALRKLSLEERTRRPATSRRCFWGDLRLHPSCHLVDFGNDPRANCPAPGTCPGIALGYDQKSSRRSLRGGELASFHFD